MITGNIGLDNLIIVDCNSFDTYSFQNECNQILNMDYKLKSCFIDQYVYKAIFIKKEIDNESI